MTLPADIDPTTRKHHPNGHNKRPQVYFESTQLQRVAVAKAFDPDTKPSDLAQLMRAYEVLERLKRDIRMRPKPKPIDTSTLHRKSKRKSATLATSPDGSETA